MLVSKAIELIRQRINDAEYQSGYTDANLIQYINDAVKYLSMAMIARNDPTLTHTYVLESSTTNEVPKNFVRFAGGYPVRRQGNYLFITDGATTVTTKYFYVPDEVEAVTDTLPFDGFDSYGMLIIDIASIYALNQHEFNVERDIAMKQEIEQMIIKALGAIE